VLILIQECIIGAQITSLVKEALGGLIVTFQVFRIMNSDMLEATVFEASSLIKRP